MAAPPPPPPMPTAAPSMAALPPGWQQFKTAQGQIYFANAATGQSSYTPPTAMPALPAGFSSALVAASPPPMPVAGPSTATAPADQGQGKKKSKAKSKVPIEGTKWLKVTTNDGNVFYTHTETKLSSWTVPEEIQAQVAAIETRERLARAGAIPKAQPTPVVEAPVEEEEEMEGGGDEAMEEMTPEAAAELAAIRAEMDAQRGVVTKKRPAEGDEAKKNKRKKPKVVHSLAEVDEEFQKEIAEEMAAEAEREERGEPPVEATKPAASDMTSEENIALFKSMLAEKDINPFAPWEDALPKFVNDPRYKAVGKVAEKRDLFEDFCKEKVREQRAKKKDTKQDPQQAFRQLLVAEVTSTRAHWEDFRRAHKKDARFRGFGRDDREREKVFRNWLRDLGEMKRADAKRHEDFFLELLGEQPGITPTSEWSQIKRNISNDPRYDNVGSSSLREGLFHRYLAQLDNDAAPTEEAKKQTEQAKKATRRQQSLREREEQVQRQRETVERAAGRSRQEAGREEGERELRSLFIDSVRDHEAKWEDLLPQLQRDPRFDMGNLAPHERRQLFDDHLETLRTKRVDALESLFTHHTPALNSTFADVYPNIVNESAVTRMHVSPEQLENMFETWQRRNRTIARNDFDAMLNDSSFVEFWGRTKAEATDKKAEEATRKALDGDDEEAASAEQFDLRAVARAIDVKDLHAVLRNDARYRRFDYDPEVRESWIRDHLANLAAPNLTVHQRH